MLKRFRNRRLAPSCDSINKVGNHAEDNPVIMDTISRICPPACSPQRVIDLVRDVPLYNGPHAWMDSPFAYKEFEAVLDSAKLTSSPGLDKIDYRTLKILPYDLKALLLRIINNLFLQGKFPKEWCHSLVYLIPKPHGGGVRPIALTSCLLKSLEKLIFNRLYWYIESGDVLPIFQYGFRKFRSCQDNLTTLTAEIFSGFVQDRVTVGVFINIKAAFDNVIPYILIDDLKELKLPPRILKFIENLILSRTVQFVIQGRLSEPLLSRKGTPQGSVLSPILFNLYLRNISSVLHQLLHTKILQFSDDIVIYSMSSSVDKARNSVERSLSNIDTFLHSKGLDISPQKTQMMVFSRRKVCSTAGHIILNNTTIKPIFRLN